MTVIEDMAETIPHLDGCPMRPEDRGAIQEIQVPWCATWCSTYREMLAAWLVTTQRWKYIPLPRGVYADDDEDVPSDLSLVLQEPDDEGSAGGVDELSPAEPIDSRLQQETSIPLLETVQIS